MKKIFLFLTLIVFGTMVFFSSVQAQDIGLVVEGENLGQRSGLSQNNVQTTTAQIINVSLGFLGILCVSLLVYAGFLWMTAMGEEAKIEKAKKTIWAAVIGLIIILSSWAITRFVLESSYSATTGNRAQIF